MLNHRSALRYTCFIVLGFATCGCGGGPEIVPVTGTVLYQGKPLAGATVVFILQGDLPGTVPLATATTDAEGRFQLQTNVSPTNTREGARTGDHRVTVSKFVPPKGMTEESYEKASQAAGTGVYNPKGGPPPRIELLPPQYSSSKDTTLTAKVVSGQPNEIKLELK